MKLEPIVCTSGHEFLKYLDPINPDWNGWYFRGQPSDEYELIPSVWREEVVGQIYSKFRTKMKHHIDAMRVRIQDLPIVKNNTLKMEHALEWELLVRFENYLLCDFYNVANKAGLKIADRLLLFLLVMIM